MTPDQPYNVCHACGHKYGKHLQSRAVGVWKGTCGVCGKEDVPCAGARDYGYLKPEWEDEKND